MGSAVRPSQLLSSTPRNEAEVRTVVIFAQLAKDHGFAPRGHARRALHAETSENQAVMSRLPPWPAGSVACC